MLHERVDFLVFRMARREDIHVCDGLSICAWTRTAYGTGISDCLSTLDGRDPLLLHCRTLYNLSITWLSQDSPGIECAHKWRRDQREANLLRPWILEVSSRW